MHLHCIANDVLVDAAADKEMANGRSREKKDRRCSNGSFLEHEVISSKGILDEDDERMGIKEKNTHKSVEVVEETVGETKEKLVSVSVSCSCVHEKSKSKMKRRSWTREVSRQTHRLAMKSERERRVTFTPDSLLQDWREEDVVSVRSSRTGTKN